MKTCALCKEAVDVVMLSFTDRRDYFNDGLCPRCRLGIPETKTKEEKSGTVFFR